jgi:integrase
MIIRLRLSLIHCPVSNFWNSALSRLRRERQAFAIACRQNAVKFTPHSAKHCIGAERDERPLTQIERKAWSENMGHENEQITERHYGKVPDERRFEVLEHIGTNARQDHSGNL